MVEVFKTNIRDLKTAEQLKTLLHAKIPEGRINFDLEDCDRILRVESKFLIPDEIVNLLTRKGYFCEVLD